MWQLLFCCGGAPRSITCEGNPALIDKIPNQSQAADVLCSSLSSRSFLINKDGNPNKRNVHNETSLHLLCMGPQILTSEGALQPRISRPYEDEQRRTECLHIILSWTGAKLDHGEYESAEINATDNKKNTCLHYAAASGMRTSVEVRF